MVNLARLIIFLSLLGVIPAGLIFLIDISVHSVTLLREKVSVTDTGGLLGFLIYLSSGVLLCLMSTLICRVVSTEAEGSGIPQMKAIMSGFYDKCKPALSLWAMVAKAFGLICAIGKSHTRYFITLLHFPRNGSELKKLFSWIESQVVACQWDGKDRTCTFHVLLRTTFHDCHSSRC